MVECGCNGTSSVSSKADQIASGGSPSLASRTPAYLALALILLVVLTFGAIFFYNFLTYDDDVLVYKNPLLVGEGGLAWLRMWSEPYERVYIPLTHSFLAVELQFSALFRDPGDGLDPRVFRFGSLALHAGCVLLVFVLLWQLIRDEWAAALGAALFAVHPLQVESVAWISETKGLLSSFWALLALVFYCRYLSLTTEAPTRVKSKNHSLTVSPRAAYWLATVAFALALLAKNSSVSLAVVAAVLDFGWYRRRAAVVARSLIPWFALALVAVFIATRAQSLGDEAISTLGARVLLSAHSLAWYLQKLLVPVGLSPVYDLNLNDVLDSQRLYWSWALPVLAVVVLSLLPGRRVWLVALAIFVVVPAPLLGLVPFDFQRISTVADRYAYLAMLGPALAVSYLVTQFPRRIAVPAAAVAIATLAIVSHVQTRHWQNVGTLFTRATNIAPDSAFAWNNLGTYAFRNEEFAKAVSSYTRAVELQPEYSAAHSNLGSALATRGDWPAAIAAFRHALELDPGLIDTQRSLARALLKTEDYAGAEAAFRQAMSLSEDPRDEYREFGIALLTAGRTGEAEAWYREAMERFPTWPHAHANLAVALASQGKYEAAEVAILEALRLDPSMQDAKQNLELIRKASSKAK